MPLSYCGEFSPVDVVCLLKCQFIPNFSLRSIETAKDIRRYSKHVVTYHVTYAW